LLGAAPWCSRRAADSLASRAVTALAPVASLMPGPDAPQPVVLPSPPQHTVPAPPGSARQGRSPSRASRSVKLPAPARGIIVRRQTVQAAVHRGIRPSASPVAATARHPAGLVVTGWSAAGAGLMDGDIITSVGGRTPSAVDDVIAAVAGACKAGTYAVSGRVWRNGETLPVTVELPMPGNRAKKPRAQSLASRSTGGP
jgi:hypothetical protein